MEGAAGLDRVRDLAVYQRLEAAARIPETGQSRNWPPLGESAWLRVLWL